MSSYDSVGDLLRVLDGQADALLGQDDVHLLIGLRGFLDFVLSEPLLSAVATDVASSVRLREDGYATHLRGVLKDIQVLWSEYESLFTAAEKQARTADQLDLFQTVGLSLGSVPDQFALGDHPKPAIDDHLKTGHMR